MSGSASASAERPEVVEVLEGASEGERRRRVDGGGEVGEGEACCDSH